MNRQQIRKKSRAIKRRRSRIPQFRPGAFQSNIRTRSGELKALDIYTNTTQITNNAILIQPLNLIQAGSSFYNRVGRKIRMNSVHLRAFFDISRVTNDDDFARVVLIYDRQTNGAVPVFSDMFQVTDQAGTASSDTLSFINLNNRDRFVILKDYRVLLPIVEAGGISTMHNTTYDQNGKTVASLDCFVKCNLETQYKADSSPSVITDISTGSLLLIIAGSNFNNGANGWNLTWTTRVRFVDS